MTLTCDPQHQGHQRPVVSNQLKGLAIAFVVIGIALRLVFLEQEFFWGDEVLTALRISGYPELAVIDGVYHGQAVTPADLLVYQQPQGEPGLGAVMTVLADHPEHPPLYYLLNRGWTRLMTLGGLWRDRPVSLVRSLSIVLSLATLPVVFGWLRQYFGQIAAWVAIALFAVSPLHVLYAQEARQYSLWMLLIVASHWALMNWVRHPTGRRWGLYSLLTALGLYTHLLFTVVMVGQGIYVAATQGWRVTPLLRRYGLAVGLAVLAFMPWLGVMVLRWEKLQRTAAQGMASRSGLDLGEDLFRLINRVFFNADLTWANGILVLLVGLAMYSLWRRSPSPPILLVLSLVIVPSLVLVGPDLLLGTVHSTRVRYMIPAYVGIQLAIALWFAQGIAWDRQWRGRLWRFGFSLVLVGSVAGSLIGVYQVDVPWIKSGRVQDYLDVAAQLNREPLPIVSDTRPVRAIALSYRLDPSLQLYLLPPTEERLADIMPPRLRDRSVPTASLVAIAHERLWVVDPSPQLFGQLATLGHLSLQVDSSHLPLWEWTP